MKKIVRKKTAQPVDMYKNDICMLSNSLKCIKADNLNDSFWVQNAKGKFE